MRPSGRWPTGVTSSRTSTPSATGGANGSAPAAWQLGELVLRHPVVNARFIATELGIAPQNAYRALRPLLEADVLVELSDRKRNQLWRAPEVLDALDRFAARAGRRARGRG
jgi:hypothetical protein